MDVGKYLKLFGVEDPLSSVDLSSDIVADAFRELGVPPAADDIEEVRGAFCAFIRDAPYDLAPDAKPAFEEANRMGKLLRSAAKTHEEWCQKNPELGSAMSAAFFAARRDFDDRGQILPDEDGRIALQLLLAGVYEQCAAELEKECFNKDPRTMRLALDTFCIDLAVLSKSLGVKPNASYSPYRPEGQGRRAPFVAFVDTFVSHARDTGQLPTKYSRVAVASVIRELSEKKPPWHGNL